MQLIGIVSLAPLMFSKDILLCLWAFNFSISMSAIVSTFSLENLLPSARTAPFSHIRVAPLNTKSVELSYTPLLVYAYAHIQRAD